MAVIVVPYPLREKLGEEAADALVTLINEADEDNKASIIELAEQRFERRLAEELAKFRVEVNEAISRVRTEMLGEIAKLRVEMHDLRVSLIQWMFIFWLGQIGVIAGLLFAFLRK